MHTPVLAHIRTCKEDVEVRKVKQSSLSPKVFAPSVRLLNSNFAQIAPGMLIKKGFGIELPIRASHYHPEFFPNPTKFEPERFLKENADKIIPYTYRPFGGNQIQDGRATECNTIELLHFQVDHECALDSALPSSRSR